MPWAHEFTEAWQLAEMRAREMGGADEKERAWKPFAPEGTPTRYARDRVVDVRHVRAEVALDVPARSISATVRLTVSPVAEPVASLALDAEDLRVSAVTCDRSTSLGWRNPGKRLELTFDPPLAVGEDAAISVEYSATPQRGLHFIAPDEDHPDKRTEVWSQCFDEDARCWLPCLDVPHQKATTEMIATVPGGWFCLSNGVLVDRRANEDGTATFHWRMDVPNSTYLTAFAAGEYAEVEDEWDGIPVNYYVPPDKLDEGKRSFGRTPEMVAFYSDIIGVRYPFAKYAQITATDFRYGGMENSTATIQTWRTLHDERASLDTTSEPLVAHELVHSWFGDLVTCRDWSHAWLNEGFATFFDKLWFRHSRGEDEFRYEMYGAMRGYLGEDSGRYRRGIVNTVYRYPVDLFDAHIYAKGGCVLNLLRTQLGDALFFRAVKEYVERNAGANATTADLVSAFEDVTGRSLDRFFDQWVYKGGHPQFEVSAVWDDKTRLLALTVKQTQKPDEMTSIFALPLKVRFVGGAGESAYDETRTFDVEDAEHTFHVPLGARPDWIAFDPANTIPKTLELKLDEDMLRAQLAQDDDVMGRVYAAQALAKKGTLAAVEALREALLKDAYWGVQAESADALATVRTPAAFEALREAVGLEHPKARRAVVRALGAWRTAEAFDALLPTARSDASYHVEAEAVEALSRTLDERAWEELVAALERESHHDVVRNAALRGLVSLDAKRAIEVLEPWCQARRPDTVRNGAFGLLARAVRESDAPEDVKLRVRRMLERVAETGLYHERTAAMGALRELREAAAIPLLQAIQASGAEPGITKAAERAIEGLRDTSGLPAEVKALRTELDKVKEEAAELKQRLENVEGRGDEGA